MAEKKASTPRKRTPKKTEAAAPAAVIDATPVAAVAMDDTVATPVVLTEEAVRQRAYEIHLAKGGSAFENWLQAERELRG